MPTHARPSSKAAAATEAPAAEAALDMLARGNAVDAVVAAVAAAAAASPTVLLGSMQMLVGGAGAGLLAFDGRSRQPGQGVPRPRGFLENEPVPEAATVAAPTLPATLAAAAASSGTASLRRLFRSAIAVARARSAERAAVLEAIAGRGAPALVDGFIADELVVAGGRAARGLLTNDDLGAARPSVTRCYERKLPPSGIFMVPWLGDTSVDASSTQVVVAADGRGLVAIACYEAPPDGVLIPSLGLSAPRSAAPVMRGEKRVAPGAPRPAGAPIALRSIGGFVDLAMGLAGSSGGQTALSGLAASPDVAYDVTATLSAVLDGKRIVLARAGSTTRVTLE